MPRLICLVVLLACTPVLAAAQSNPLTTQARYLHEGLKTIALESAQRMPDDKYAFRPVESVRTYAEILGHIADMQYMYCAVLLGEANQRPSVERSATTKTQLLAALRDTHTYCDRAFVGLNDSTGAGSVSFMGNPIPRLSLLGVSFMHTSVHYGNMATYMRMNGVIPPTSDPAIAPQAAGSRR